MKKIIFTFISILFTVVSFAGDIFINSGTTNANMPAKKNQTITQQFTFANTAEAIGLGFDPTKITISLRKLQPVLDGSGLPIVSGITGFTTTYDDVSKVITLTQNATIAEDAAFVISFDAVVTDETTQANVGTQGHGFLANIVPGSTVTGNQTSNDALPVWGYTDGVLPVLFGAINGSFSGNQLNVSWETLSEQHNKEFIVEVSKDGKEFYAAGTVASLAKEGSSEAVLKYTFSRAWSEVNSLLGYSLITGILLLSIVLMFFVRKAKYKKLMVPMAFSAIVLLAFSCNKKDDPVIITKTDTFVRIIQVDIDGTKNASKVIKIAGAH